MSRFTSDEIEAAFERYQAAALVGGTTGDWTEWVECFTEDCTYKEHLYGVMGGRAAIKRWIDSVMVETYPGNEMCHFPIEWYVVDEERGWIVCQDTNGDGTCGATDPVLQRIDSPAKVQVTRTGGGASIKLNRWGLVDGTWLGFSLVPLDKSTSHPGARGVCMSSGGRIRVIPPESIPCTG